MADNKKLDISLRDGKRLVVTGDSLKSWDERVLEAAKGKKYEKDRSGGVSGRMYDPDSPFPKSFDPRVTPRWQKTKGVGLVRRSRLIVDGEVVFEGRTFRSKPAATTQPKADPMESAVEAYMKANGLL